MCGTVPQLLFLLRGLGVFLDSTEAVPFAMPSVVIPVA